VRPWHDPQQSVALLLKARPHIFRALELSEAGDKREAAKELARADALRKKAREPLGRLTGPVDEA
jgi:hypothetical protein